ncbi:MAG TPA: hypothetical protein VEG37_06075 [Burkholderiales bacterium]|nr:hypothetical protein [Burkholderiales bacterium]
MLNPIEKFPGICVFGCALWFGAAIDVMAAEWQVSKELSGNKDSCITTSAKMPVDDGYQKISAQIIVDSKTVTVKTESELDPGFSDIGLKVGNRDWIPMDKVGQKKLAVFETNYSKIVEEFKIGREVTVRLRFWPTWPVTGTHPVSFSLIGFTKAYAEAMACK